MEFNEHFIDAQIADLVKEYDLISAININAARVCSEIIDGLKPVQRRTLYIMYTKEGGRKFRKIASISGDVFGKAHPHCLHGRTRFLLSDGNDITIENMYKMMSLNPEINILSWDQKNQCIVPSVVHDVRITKYVKEYHRITLSNGDTICCTNDHRIKVYHRGEITWKEAEDLDIGDKLISGNVCTDEIKAKYWWEDSDIELNIDRCNSSIKNTNITVDKIEIVSLDEEEPMYDFTVDEWMNGVIVTGSLCPRSFNNRTFHVASNSPTAIDDSIINMSQSWRNTIPLIEPFGNNGSISGDEAGASRYVQARLSEYAIACFFEDWKDSVVDMDMSYDEETKLPEYLPAKYPNVLLNGTLGIGHGLAVNIPSYNFREVVEATIMLMNHPDANVILIPDTPTGADIIENDFGAICNRGIGSFTERCTYEIDPDLNIITITSLPDLTKAIDVRAKIAEIKERGGFSELTNMNDLSGKRINIQLCIRNDVNPYKFMRKLIEQVPGLERTYPINITVTQNYNNYDYSIKQALIEWIKWRRDQKRVTLINKCSGLLGEQRILEIKLFIMNENNLQDTIKIFKNGKNRAEIEEKLLEKYKNSEIHIDSLQARTLSNMRMVDLSLESQQDYRDRAKEVKAELDALEDSLKDPKGVDKLIIAELRDGIKRFGVPRRSNVVPKKISVSNEVEGVCILQLSSDGIILRKQGTNVEEEPIPTDSNGFACLVDNDSSFILIDDTGNHSFIKVKELPVDTEVPVARYSKKPLTGNIVALLPADIESDKICVLVSKKGIVKRIRISDIGPSKKPCISIDKDDRLLKGIVMKPKSNKEILIYTKDGNGQRVDPESIRITLPSAKGGNGFKLAKNDEIVGCYQISPEQNQYLLYITTKGKMRLNNIQYLPTRNSKHDAMVQLISIGNRDHLFAVVGCNKLDKVNVFYDDGSSEVVDISTMQEGTMASEPKKVTQKNAVSSNITKVKLV